jgi:hypothetical protein
MGLEMTLDLFGGESLSPVEIKREDLQEVFAGSLYRMTEKDLVSMMYSMYEAVIDYAALCKGERTGQKISMLFNPHRYSTRTIDSKKSIVEAFGDMSWLSGLARATAFKHGRVKDLLYQVLQLGINGVQYVNEFPPHVAQGVYIKHRAKKILDPCAGWGGRMIGAASIGAEYHGFEPARKTCKGLRMLGQFLKSFKNGFSYKIECVPFEDAILGGKTYDVAFTSPPYYDTEIYSDEPTNSCNRYATFDDWCKGFYFPMVERMTVVSKVAVLNIGERKYPLAEVLRKNGYRLDETKDSLSGKGGLGREDSGAERFYVVTAQTNPQGDNP